MKNIFTSIRNWQRRNQTINSLSKLDDRMLADVGLVRGNIADAVRSIR